MKAYLHERLDELRRADLLRDDRPYAGEALALCSNDYLGYAGQAVELAAPAGAGASRLVGGDHAAHRDLEGRISVWLGCEAALLFSSGYAANVGCIAALADRGTVVVSDALNHASIIDGCRLGRAGVVVVPHRDVAAVAAALREARDAGQRWVVTESYFSMDGDTPDLGALRRVCDEERAALIVDEAHALGVFGEGGRGLCHQHGVRPDVLIGTLGKAIGMQGAFVAGSRELRALLWNRARSFVFSTGVSPWLAAATARRLEQVIADEAGRARLAAMAERFRSALSRAGAKVTSSHGPVLPWIVGDEATALGLSAALLERGVFVPAIRPPTVPPGTARLRVTVSAGLDDRDVDRALAALAEVAALCSSDQAAARRRRA